MRGTSAFVCLALATLASGCTLLAPYDGQPEDCDNRIDDDFDGATDCDDDACFGRVVCGEEDLARCTNGLDDDGDGRADFADATCWPEGIATVERCSSVLGGDLLSLDWDGAVRLAPDPDGTRGDVYVLESPVGYATAHSRATLAGALDGLEGSVDVRLPSTLQMPFGISLGVPTPARASGHAVGLLFYASSLHPGRARVTIGHLVDGMTVTDGTVDGLVPLGAWVTVTVSVHDGSFTFGAVGEPGRLSTPVPDDFPTSDALQFYVGGPPDVALLQHVITRAALERCTDAPATGVVPPYGVTENLEGLQTTRSSLAAARELSDGACALAYDEQGTTPRLVALAAEPGEWTVLATIDPESQGRGTLPSPRGLTHWHGAVLAEGAPLGTFAVFTHLGTAAPFWNSIVARGPGCGALAPLGDAALPAVPGRARPFVPPVGLDVDAQGVTLTVVTLPGTEGDPLALDFPHAELQAFRSPSGDPGTFEVLGAGDTTLFEALDPDRADHGGRFDMPRLRRVGRRDRVATVRRWDGHIELWVERSRGWVHVPGIAFDASNEDSSFDADALGFADLVEDAPSAALWRGRLVYTGYYVDERARQTARLGPARLSIRAPGTAP